MWFVSKYARKKHPDKGGVRFLRKRLATRHEGRAIAGQDKSSRIPSSVFVLWLLLAATLFYIAFFSLFFLVGTPRLAGMSEVSEEALSGSVETELAGTYLGIFPKRNFFLIRPHILEERLLSEYPLFASVSVTRVFPDSMRVEVREREKIVLWCSGEPSRNAFETIPPAAPCSLIDEEGRAKEVGRALSPENIPYVLFITDTSGKSAALGEKVFDPGYGAFVIRMNEMFLEQLGFALEPQYATVSRFANEVRAKTSEGWEVYVSSDIPIDSSLNALKLLFMKELPQEKRAKLAYIDLRVENRAYYAFREEEAAEHTENPSDPSSVSTEDKKAETESKKK